MNPKRIIVHHSATPDQKTFDWEAIRRYHTRERGWTDIGYHFGVEAVGDDGHLTVLFGRWPNEEGAHTLGRNRDSLGLCVVGNFDAVSPTVGQYEAAGRLCAWLCWIYGMNPREDIQPHSMYAPKTCPGRLFDMSRLRDIASERMRGWWRPAV